MKELDYFSQTKTIDLSKYDKYAINVRGVKQSIFTQTADGNFILTNTKDLDSINFTFIYLDNLDYIANEFITGIKRKFYVEDVTHFRIEKDLVSFLRRCNRDGWEDVNGKTVVKYYLEVRINGTQVLHDDLAQLFPKMQIKE